MKVHLGKNVLTITHTQITDTQSDEKKKIMVQSWQESKKVIFLLGFKLSRREILVPLRLVPMKAGVLRDN